MADRYLLNVFFEKTNKIIEMRKIDAGLTEELRSLKAELENNLENAKRTAKTTLHQLRACLFKLRQAANQIHPLDDNVESFKKAIHEVLCNLSVIFPLNTSFSLSMILPLNTSSNKKGFYCALSGRPINCNDPYAAHTWIALSNGYIYLTDALKEEGRITHGKQYFKQLGNISQYDVDAFHAGEKTFIGAKYLAWSVASVIVGAIMWFGIQQLSAYLLGAGLLDVVQLSLVGAGLSMGVATGFTCGLIVLPIVAAIAYFVGKAIYERYWFDKEYSSTLEPDKSTNKMLDVLDGTPSRERQNLEVDQNTNDKNDVLVPLVASQDARNDVELGVVYQEQQVVEDHAARTYSVY